MSNPYLIQGPALISFSGGRTSGYMLKQILDAHDGTLPPDVYVAFANTGMERHETLRFVHECEVRWGVPIIWVEWRATLRQASGRALSAWLQAKDPDRRMVAADGFERVGFNSASRNGEPFEALIAMKNGRLPNWQERWCTEFLKVKSLIALATSLGLKPGGYREVIGLRADEEFRVLRSIENAMFRRDPKTKKQVPRVPPRQVQFPLAKAKVGKPQVMDFWRAQPFDLGLQPHEGNCTLCFMKGKQIRLRIIRDVPGVADWWNEREIAGNQFFDRRDRVIDLIEEARRSPGFFDEADLSEEHDAECGVLCAYDQA